MNRRFGWAVLLLVLIAAAVGVVSYNAGVSHGIAMAPVAGGAPLATMAGQSVCTPTGTPMLPVVAQTRVLAT